MGSGDGVDSFAAQYDRERLFARQSLYTQPFGRLELRIGGLDGGAVDHGIDIWCDIGGFLRHEDFDPFLLQLF